MGMPNGIVSDFVCFEPKSVFLYENHLQNTQKDTYTLWNIKLHGAYILPYHQLYFKVKMGGSYSFILL